MRVFLSALMLGSLSLTPLAQAHTRAADTVDMFAAAHIPESYALARRLAEGEAPVRAGGLAAGVLIASVINRDAGDTELVVTNTQRDAVLKVLKNYGYLGHLAQVYAAMMQVEDLRAAVALYDDPRMASAWKFQTAAISALLSQSVPLEVQLPDALIEPLSDGEALATRESIGHLVGVWFEGVEEQYDVDALITGIQARTTARDIEEFAAVSEIPITAKLRMVQKSSRFMQFDRKELESPRFRNALTNALLLAR